MAAAEFEDTADLTQTTKTNENGDVGGVIVECARRREIFPAKAQRRKERR